MNIDLTEKPKEHRGSRYESARPVLPEPTLRRMPWYLAVVGMLRQQGVEYVSSTALSRSLNVDASQIAKDLSFLGLRGKTRIGYECARLEDELSDFLGFTTGHNAIIVGVGSLGAALVRDKGLRRYGLDIVAGFDINPDIVGRDIDGVPIHPIETLDIMRPVYKAEIGIITVPAEAAQLTADALVASGVRALWNFSPFRISTPENIVINNTSIYANLAVIYNRMDAQKRMSVQ